MTNRDRDPSDPQSGEDGRTEPTEDEVWRDLVARFEQDPATGREPEHPQPPDPRAPDAQSPGPAPPAEQPSEDADRGRREAGAAPDSEHLGGPRDYSPPPEDEGYTPEEPPPLAGAQPLSVLAWIGAVGAPILMLLSAVFWRSAPFSAVLGMIIVFVVSAAFLIMRLPRERDNDDDGAVV